MTQSLSSPPPVARVHTLGSLGVEAPDGEAYGILRQPKRFGLLVYLLLATKDGFVSRDTVTAVFWPELDQDRARGALRNSLYFLRKTFGHDVMEAEGTEALRVDSTVLWCDALAFDGAIRGEDYRTALQLYAGDFLAGFHLNGSPDFEEWLSVRRDDFRRQALRSALELATRAEGAQNATAAEVFLRRATEMAPHDDAPAHRLIALLSANNRVAALEAFARFEERLAELSLSPAPETVELVDRLRLADSRRAEPKRESPQVVAAEAKPPGRSDTDRPSEGPARPRRVMQRSARVTVALALVAIVAAATFGPRWWEARWAQTRGFQNLRFLVAEHDFVSAFALAKRLAPWLDGDPEFAALRKEITLPVSVRTDPPGAEVFIQDYRRPEDDWIPLGTTPLDDIVIPGAYLRWRIERAGYASQERAALNATRPIIRFVLPSEPGPSRMDYVSGDAVNIGAPFSMQLDAYWLDRYEVTNREYEVFVNAGGYAQPALWAAEFEDGDTTLSFQDVMTRLTDGSGFPGPSVWTAGAFPSDRGELPVRGVSWYEADAYCRWAGKELPTVYHWYGAGGYSGHAAMIALSNFSRDGPAAVGAHGAIGPYGHHDLAGNVREWASNAADERRYILGGGWDSPRYLFWHADAAPPLDRSPLNGFRCAVFDVPPDHAARTPVQPRARNFEYTPVSDAEYETYKALYAYDRSHLNEAVDSVSDLMPHWRREFVSFDAAYGGERMQAHLFLPRHQRPPYGAVVFYPGADAFRLESSDLIRTFWFDFIVRSGRAVIYPIYKGTYERRVPVSGPKDYRDQLVQRAKDLQRSVDYLGTRSDIDVDRLAYYGFSEGAIFAPVFVATGGRFVTSIALSGGLWGFRFDSIIEPTNYLGRTHTPLLLIGGEFDFIFPATSSQQAFFDAWAAPNEDKRYVALPHGHAPTEWPEAAAAILAWLDRYLGPVGSRPVQP